LDTVELSSKTLSEYLSAILHSDAEIESPVSIAAKVDNLTKSDSPQNQVILQSIIDRLDMLSNRILGGDGGSQD